MKSSRARRTPDAEWTRRYADQLATAEKALSRLRPGQRIFLASAGACPLELLQALGERADRLADMELVQLFPPPQASEPLKRLRPAFRINQLVAAPPEGVSDYTPLALAEVPGLFACGRLPLDVALVQVTPPDAQGWCSLGITTDVCRSAIENAALVIAEVNPHLPWTTGDSLINVHDLDVLVPVDRPLPEIRPPAFSQADRRIGELAAALVEDGSTVGADGGAPAQATLAALRHRRDLGIHGELFTETAMELIECGAANGSAKPVDRGRAVVSLALGSRRLYDFVDQNPLVTFQPVNYVCDSLVIRKLEHMVSLTTVEEVDLSGQAGIGVGQSAWLMLGSRVDFHRGTLQARGGKGIWLLPSLKADGSSAVVVRLGSACQACFSREDAQFVVTEHGVAFLQGRSLQERALSLMAVAHPRFRAQLLKAAIEQGLVKEELAALEDRLQNIPAALRSVLLLADGTAVTFRPILPTDESRIKELFYALSQQSIYYRWMSNLNRLPEGELRNQLFIDHRKQVALAGTLPAAQGEELVAVGGYALNPGTNRAEVALVVRDEWQRRGIGTFLLKLLIQIARKNGIAGFTAEVLRQNIGMQIVFNEKSGCRVTSSMEEGAFHFELDFE